MKITSVSWKNFGSYGNRWVNIDLSDEAGFYLIQGKNGGGKSTISDVIKFAIYGKLENKKLKDIANRTNRNMEVKVEMSTRSGKVVIERAIDPGYFKLFLNGKEIDKAGKRSVQEYLEDELLEMPFYVFSNTLSLSINDFKSFIRMNNFDKKAIIDKIFGLQVLNQMRELLKLQTRQLKETIDRLDASAIAFGKTLSTSQAELASLEEKIRKNQGEKKSEMEEQAQKITVFVAKARSVLSELDENIGKANDAKHKLTEAISGDSQLFVISKEKVELYKNSKCPHCLSDLTTDFHQETMKQYESAMLEAEKNLGEKKERMAKLNDLIRAMQEKRKEAQRQFSSADANLTVLVNQIEGLSAPRNVDEQTSSLKKLAEEAQNNITSSKEEKSKTERKIIFHQMVEEILGEKGVKQMAIKTILPTFNAEVARLTSMLGIEHRVHFDEEFNARITHFGVEVSPDTFSTGESNKVDFAVLLAIIRMMKIKYPSLNMLFLDELFSSIDGDGIYHILKILRETVKDMHLNTFVISHYPLAYTEFDYKIDVTKNNGFSSFVVEKVT
jgi:exonuclease SbcC